MFNLNKKVEYSLELLTFLAKQETKDPVGLKKIAEEKDLPYKYLEQIARELRDAGFINSKEGKGGGYFLADKPSNIAIADIVTVLTGPVTIGACAGCQQAAECGQQEVWSSVGDSLRQALAEKTLEDLVA